MSAVSSVQQQVASTVEIQVLKLANEQQQAKADLVESALETAAQVQESGKGELLDLLA